jgi:hypothetical protein
MPPTLSGVEPMADLPDDPTATAATPRLNVCENKGCDGTMRTTRVTCGRDSGSETRCNKCGRTVEYGWCGSRVLYDGRCQASEGRALQGGHPDDCLIPGAERA